MDRQLNYCPQHFVKCNAQLTENSHLWIKETLNGRYYIGEYNLFFDPNVYFEDPQEAIFYELTWS